MIFEQMKQALVDAAQRAGIDEYEIYYQNEESVSAEALKDEISAFSSGVAGGICFRCIVNGKMGSASGELMTAEAMEELVQHAVSNAECIDSEDEAVLFEGSPSYESVEERQVQLSDTATVRDNALRLQQATYATSECVGDGTQSVVFSSVGETHLYNSKGLSLSNRVGMSGAYVAPVVRRGEEAQESFEFGEGERFEQLTDLPQKAVQGALDKLGATLVDSGKYDIIIKGDTFRNFLAAFAPAFSAKNAQLGLSLLSGKEGERIAADCITVSDDPLRVGCPMQTSFDGEGVATHRKNIIENGVLKTLLYDLTTARKAGVASTGNGQRGGYASPVSIAPYSFCIHAGTHSREELFDKVQNGIYITECKGFHAGADAVTGDFSIESAGFMLRDGKRAEALKSFTVSGNFFELLRAVECLGNEVEWGVPNGLTVFGSPDVLLRQASIAGK